MDKEKGRKANSMSAIGVAQMCIGAMTVLLFSVIDLVRIGLAAIGNIRSGAGESAGFPIIFIIGIVFGGAIIWRGIFNFKLASSFRKTSKVIGECTVISFINLERRLCKSRKQVLNMLGKQMKNGFWPGAHIDMTNELFMLEYDPIYVKSETGESIIDEQLGSMGSMIHTMQAAARQIEDEGLKAQVEIMTGMAGQIYTCVSENPEKASTVRRLTNYFLPTTVELLERYIELQNQNIKTDNMNEALEKIIDVMTTIEAVFKNQLDALYSDKVMDVDVEIEVLQNMAGLQ